LARPRFLILSSVNRFDLLAIYCYCALHTTGFIGMVRLCRIVLFRLTYGVLVSRAAYNMQDCPISTYLRCTSTAALYGCHFCRIVLSRLATYWYRVLRTIGVIGTVRLCSIILVPDVRS
jgi:hypothetical protein